MSSPYSISHFTTGVRRPEHTFNFQKPTDLIREVRYFYYFHDPILVWDAAVVRSIKEFDPTVIPCFVKRVYRVPTGGDMVLSYFAILREKYPTINEKIPFTIRRCGCAQHAHLWPNIEEVVFSDASPSPGWPESFMPCDARMALRLKRIFWLTEKSMKDFAREYIEADQTKQERAEASLKAESDYRWSHDWGHIKRVAEKVSGPEAAAMGQPQERPSKAFAFHHPPTPSASPKEGV